jgi:peptidyl-tRNA hydrolase
MTDQTLRLYAIVRGDLEMPPGKLAAQAGHAFLESYLNSDPSIQTEYRQDGVGTKITLRARHLDDILWAQFMCEQECLSHAIIVDEGHVMPPHFDGSPIITAIGIGPYRREDISHITDKFRLV